MSALWSSVLRCCSLTLGLMQDPESQGKGITPVSRLLERYFTADSSAQAKAAVQRTLRANRRLSHNSTHEAELLEGLPWPSAGLPCVQ